jgi:hypothetical protein
MKKYEDNFKSVDQFSKLLISLYNDQNFCSGLYSSSIPLYESMDVLSLLEKCSELGLISCIFLQYLKREENIVQKLVDLARETDSMSKQLYHRMLKNERKPDMNEGAKFQSNATVLLEIIK